MLTRCLSCLSRTSDASPDEEKAANQRATTAKVRDKTPGHTAYIASFHLEVPPLLGKDPRVFSGIVRRYLPCPHLSSVALL